MTARRALLEDLDETRRVADLDAGRARRAAHACRRALVEDPVAPSSCARRALVEIEQLDEPVTKILPKLDASTAAFVTQRRGYSVRKLIAAAGVVAVAGTFSGAALARSAAEPVPPAVSVQAAQVDERAVALSREAARPAAEPASPSPAADLPASVAPQAAAAEPTEEPAEATAPRRAEVDIAGTIAPGQLTPHSVDEAMARAASMVGNWGYDNMCLSLVATFYGYTSSGEIGAQQAANTIMAAGQMHTDLSNIPVGALIWYDGTPVGNPYGHVAMYAGDGMVYSNGAPTGVGLIPLHEPADGWGEPIIGWSSVWLPAATQ